MCIFKKIKNKFAKIKNRKKIDGTASEQLNENSADEADKNSKRNEEIESLNYEEYQIFLENISEKVISAGNLREMVDRVKEAKDDAQKAADAAQKAAEDAARIAAKRTVRRIREFATDVANNTIYTAFGVFASIITVIISLVYTSATWLKDAGEDKVLIAFIVPAAVAVVATVIMLLVVFIHSDITNSRNNMDVTKGLLEKILKQGIPLGTLIVICAASVMGIYFYLKTSFDLQKQIKADTHTVYVIKKASNNMDQNYKYYIVEIGSKKYYRMTFDGDHFEFLEDSSLLHNGDLHFCTVHNALE